MRIVWNAEVFISDPGDLRIDLHHIDFCVRIVGLNETGKGISPSAEEEDAEGVSFRRLPSHHFLVYLDVLVFDVKGVGQIGIGVDEMIEDQCLQGTSVPFLLLFQFERVIVALFIKIGFIIDGEIEGVSIENLQRLEGDWQPGRPPRVGQWHRHRTPQPGERRGEKEKSGKE